MGSIELIKGSDGSGNANVATVQNIRAPGATTIIVDTVLSINPEGFAGTMGTPHTFTDPITSETITVISEATAVDFTGHVDGSNLEIDDIAPGYTDVNGSAVGDIIIIRPTTQYTNNLAEVLEVAHNDDGSLNDNGIHQAMPAGAVLPYAGASAPTGFLMCDGSSLVRADYTALFAAIGTAFGAADGSHFNVPDMRGRSALGVGTGSKVATFASRSGNVITVTGLSNTGDNEFQTGQAVLYDTTSGAITGLTDNTTYYLIRTGNATFSLATTRANAILGTAISLSSDGSGVQTFALSLTARTLAETGGEEDHTLTSSEMPSHTHIQDAHSHTFSGQIGARANQNFTGSGLNPYSADQSGLSINNATATNQSTGGSGAANNLQPFLALNHIIKT